MSSRNQFYQEVTSRFGLVPNFFMSAPDAPEIIEKLWEFARAGYLDNPMPSLFKERLFVYLSRFCAARYCIIRHCGFLLGRGNSSGDPAARPQRVIDVIDLLRSPSPWRRSLTPVYEKLEAESKPVGWPESGTELEDCIFTAAAVVFVEPSRSERPLELLRDALGGRRFEYLVALLAFVRTAHYWTVTHPGLAIEDDVRDLMAEHPILASLLLQDPDAGRSEGR